MDGQTHTERQQKQRRDRATQRKRKKRKLPTAESLSSMCGQGQEGQCDRASGGSWQNTMGQDMRADISEDEEPPPQTSPQQKGRVQRSGVQDRLFLLMSCLCRKKLSLPSGTCLLGHRSLSTTGGPQILPTGHGWASLQALGLECHPVWQAPQPMILLGAELG